MTTAQVTYDFLAKLVTGGRKPRGFRKFGAVLPTAPPQQNVAFHIQ